MNMATMGTIMMLVTGIGTLTFLFLIITLASKNLLPEDPTDTLFHIVEFILTVLLVGFVAGIIINAIGEKRMRKKEITKNNAKVNTVLL